MVDTTTGNLTGTVPPPVTVDFLLRLLMVITIATITLSVNRAEAEVLAGSTTIGIVLPLTGDFASASGSLRRGIEVSAQRYQYKVIFEDDGGLESSKALTAVRKLIAFDHVDIIILSSFDLVPAVHPLLAQARIPGLVLWDSNDDLVAKYPWVFAIGYSPEAAGDHLGQFAHKHLNSNRVAIISADTRWSEAISRRSGRF